MVRTRYGTRMDPSSVQRRIQNADLEESQGEDPLADIASYVGCFSIKIEGVIWTPK